MTQDALAGIHGAQERPAEDAYALLQTLLELMPSGVFIAEAPSGRLTFSNAPAAQMWGHPFIPSATVRDYRAYRGYRADGRPYAPEEWPIARALQGEVVSSEEIHLQRNDGTWTTTLQSAAPMRDREGRITAAVVVMTDITERRQAEETHQHMRADLQAANQRLVAASNEQRHLAAEAKGRAAELLQQREEILSAISHDLRQPLAVVQGRAQMLERRLDQEEGCVFTPREIKGVTAIATAAQRMNAMIQDLVDAVRAEAGELRLHRQPIHLQGYVTALCQHLAPAMETERIEVLVPEGLAPVLADPERLERILVHLWSNALLHSAPGSRVTVSAAQGDGEEIVSVTDRGPGIPSEDLPRLFERSYHANGARHQGENGELGLYSTRRLVEAHGGGIWAESSPGQGNVFSFSLPLAGATQGETFEPRRVPRPQGV